MDELLQKLKHLLEPFGFEVAMRTPADPRSLHHFTFHLTVPLPDGGGRVFVNLEHVVGPGELRMRRDKGAGLPMTLALDVLHKAVDQIDRLPTVGA